MVKWGVIRGRRAKKIKERIGNTWLTWQNKNIRKIYLSSFFYYIYCIDYYILSIHQLGVSRFKPTMFPLETLEGVNL